MVVPDKQQGSHGAEKRLLQQLKRLIPDDVRPILVTDAGFRTPWIRAVSAMGWDWVGRLRGCTQVRTQDVPDNPAQWIVSRKFQALADNRAHEMPPMQPIAVVHSIAVWCSIPRRHARYVSNATDAHSPTSRVHHQI